MVDPEILFRNYTYLTAVSLGLVEHFRRMSEKIVELAKPGPDALVVEIGSNDGSMLRFFKQRGMRVLGVDPAREIAMQATATGIKTIPEFFDSHLAARIRAEHGEAAIVIANNVFAHADNLGDITDGIRTVLSSEGTFTFEVSYMVDIVRKMLFDTLYHEHLCYHAVKPLVNFFHLHGMKLIDVERIPAKGGSLHGTAQRADGSLDVSPRVGELLRLEQEMRFDQPETFRTFAADIEAVRSRFLHMLDGLLAQGKVIAGYGASATVTTLLYHFDLGRRLSFLVDDNPGKQGMYSPGHHLPILPSAALTERRPDYTVILAWTYAEPIQKRNQAYVEQGGHFIIPLPDLRVV